MPYNAYTSFICGRGSRAAFLSALGKLKSETFVLVLKKATAKVVFSKKKAVHVHFTMIPNTRNNLNW